MLDSDDILLRRERSAHLDNVQGQTGTFSFHTVAIDEAADIGKQDITVNPSYVSQFTSSDSMRSTPTGNSDSRYLDGSDASPATNRHSARNSAASSRRSLTPDMTSFPYNMMARHVPGLQPHRLDNATLTAGASDGQDAHSNHSSTVPLHPDLMIRPDPPRNRHWVVVNGCMVGIFNTWDAAQEAAFFVSGGSAPAYRSWEEALAAYTNAYEENRINIRPKRVPPSTPSRSNAPGRQSVATPGAASNPIFVSSAPNTPARLGRSPSQGAQTNPIYVSSAMSTPQRPDRATTPKTPGRAATPESSDSSPILVLPRELPVEEIPPGYRLERITTRVCITPSLSYTHYYRTELVPITPPQPSDPQRRFAAIEAALRRARERLPASPTSSHRSSRDGLSQASVLAQRGSDDDEAAESADEERFNCRLTFADSSRRGA